jgi:WD40 repeat protein
MPAMSRLTTLTLFVASLPAFAAAPVPQARDQQGDPLPPGALARLGTTRFRPGHSYALGHWLCLSPDGKVLASADFEKVSLWDSATGKLIANIAAESSPSLCFSADSKQLHAVTSDRQLISYSSLTGRALGRRILGKGRDGTGTGCHIVFSPDGKQVGLGFTGGHSDAVAAEVYHLPTGRLVRKIDLESREHLLAFSPTERHSPPATATGLPDCATRPPGRFATPCAAARRPMAWLRSRRTARPC